MDGESRATSSCDGWKKETAKLNEFEEVLFITLYWRTVDARAANPILGDHYAQETLERCEVDHLHHRRLFVSSGDQRWVRYTSNRTKTIDKWCQQFLDNHTDEPVQVLHLCCGLDARNLRMRWGDNVRWVDIDLPAVVDLRQRVMPTPPGDYSLRSLSITVDGWYRDIPADRKTIIICESFLMYIEEPRIKKLFSDLVDYFGAGQLLFDTAGSLIRKHRPGVLKKSALRNRWAPDDAREIEKYHEKLKLTGRVRWQEYMGSELPMGQNLPPVFGPWTTAMVSLKSNAKFKDCLQVLKLEFGDRTKSMGSSKFSPFSDSNGSKQSLESSTPTEASENT